MLLALALAIPAPTAFALGNDTVFLSGNALIGYNSNPFLIADGLTVPDQLGGPQKSDIYYGLGAGIRLDLPVGRQRFRANANATEYWYQHFNSLDYTGYGARASWDWVAGNKWSGLLTAGTSQTRQAFTDQQGFAIPQLITYYDASGSAQYALTPRWSLITAVGYNASKYNNDALRGNDFEVARFDLGASYRTPQGNSTGGRLRYEQGRWPNRTGIAAASFGQDYTQYTVSAVLDWHFSGQSRLYGDVGYTFRARDQAAIGDFDGPSGRLNYDYYFSGKTTLQASIYEIRGPTENTFSTYVRTRGVTLGSIYQATGKTSLTAQAGFSQVTYLGQPLTATTQQQQYDYWTVGLQALYRATRVVSLNAAVGYQWRTSPLLFGDYEVLTASLGIGAEF